MSAAVGQIGAVTSSPSGCCYADWSRDQQSERVLPGRLEQGPAVQADAAAQVDETRRKRYKQVAEGDLDEEVDILTSQHVAMFSSDDDEEGAAQHLHYLPVVRGDSWVSSQGGGGRGVRCKGAGMRVD